MTNSEANEAKRRSAKPLGIVAITHDKRFCGRCQAWWPLLAEIHYCVRAPRAIGYAWYEPDEPAIEKNSILTDGRLFKPGKIIARFEVEAPGGEQLWEK